MAGSPEHRFAVALVPAQLPQSRREQKNKKGKRLTKKASKMIEKIYLTVVLTLNGTFL